jgi:dipeptidyl aminopeptidase/acylaminoacyl peptidase
MPEPKPVSIDDLYRLRFLSDAQISPDGELVAYVERRMSRRHDEYVSHIWIVPVDGGKPRRLTRGRVRDTHPRWSPDGRSLVFTRELEKRRQLVLAQPRKPPRKRKERVLLDLDGVPSSPAWSPDGERIAFLFRPLTAEEREARRPADRRRPQPRVLRRLLNREDGRGFLPDERNHVWVMDRRGKGRLQLTHGDAEDHEPVWSPDGERVVFLSNRVERADYLTGNMDIWAVPPSGGEAVQLTREPGPFYGAAFSPDGTRIAFLGNLDPTAWVWRNFEPRLIPAEGGRSTALGTGFDRTCLSVIIHDLAEFGHSPQAPVWAADGSELVCLVSDRGACGLYRVPVDGGDPAPLLAGPRDVAAYSLSRDGRRWALVIGDATSPHEVYGWEPEAGEPRRLTRANDRFLAKRTLAVPEEVEIPVADGDGRRRALHGWVLRPPEAARNERRPLILAIHGGPMAMYGWIYFQEFQVFAAAGFTVLFTNPRGSQGYGEAHCLAIRGDWGNLDHRDLMAAADWAAAQPYVDPYRMGVTGGSYGGFMTNWIIAHTDRFRAAVTDRSISNLYSMYGATDFGWDFEWELGARPWEDPARYLRQSPLTYVDAIRTPLLIVHGEMDLRCSVEQADQLFTALKVLGREVEYVRYPEQSHGMARMGRPSLRTDRLERYVEWFRRHLVGEEDEREAELGRAHAAAGEAPTVGRHAGPVG